MNRKLRLMPNEGWFAGVCAGIAYWVGMPVWIIRLISAIIVLSSGVGFFLYIILWIFLPKWDDTPADFEEITGD